MRSVLFLAFGYGDTGMTTMFLILPFVVALDLATWYRTSRNQPVSSVFVAAAATIAGVVAVLPQIALSFTDPVLSLGNAPLIIIAIFVAAMIAAWMGRVLGEVVFNTARFELPVELPVIAKPVARIMSALTIIIVMIAVYFIITATMPSA
jgi:hypothetical protein